MSNTKRIKRILLTQSTLVNVAGSEVVTYELCKYFHDSGYEVSIFTNYFREPMASYVKKIGVTVYTDLYDPALVYSNFDLIWVHHQVLPISFLQSLKMNAKRPYIVFHHMSSYEPLEAPYLKTLEVELADMILANSFETRESLLKLIPGRSVDVLGNPAPDTFLRPTRQKYPPLPSKVLVVSNHVPDELTKALELYKSKHTNVMIDHFGLGGKEGLIEPNILTRYDLVITIGKTVQYSIAASIPVYCYDRFGGPGFLSTENFITSAWWNFSGRGFGKNSKKFSRQIVSDIENNYQKKATEFSSLHEKYADEFLLSKRLEIVFNKLQKRSPRDRPIDDGVLWISEQFISLLANETKARYKDFDALNKMILKESAKYHSDIVRLHKENYAMQQKLAAYLENQQQQLAILQTRTVRYSLRLRSIIRRFRSYLHF
jgi:hypothetical protein